MEGYAVSGQCMALVRDDCLVPTKDAPELGYVRESSDKQFVPDVYYKVSATFPFVSQFVNPSMKKNTNRVETEKKADQSLVSYVYFILFCFHRFVAPYNEIINQFY